MPGLADPQGVAHCFEKNDFGKLEDVMVIEPVSANALEGMVAGALAVGRARARTHFAFLLIAFLGLWRDVTQHSRRISGCRTLA